MPRCQRNECAEEGGKGQIDEAQTCCRPIDRPLLDRTTLDGALFAVGMKTPALPVSIPAVLSHARGLGRRHQPSCGNKVSMMYSLKAGREVQQLISAKNVTQTRRSAAASCTPVSHRRCFLPSHWKCFRHATALLFLCPSTPHQIRPPRSGKPAVCPPNGNPRWRYRPGGDPINVPLYLVLARYLSLLALRSSVLPASEGTTRDVTTGEK